MAGFEDRAKALAATAAKIARLQNAEPEATVLDPELTGRPWAPRADEARIYRMYRSHNKLGEKTP